MAAYTVCPSVSPLLLDQSCAYRSSPVCRVEPNVCLQLSVSKLHDIVEVPVLLSSIPVGCDKALGVAPLTRFLRANPTVDIATAKDVTTTATMCIAEERRALAFILDIIKFAPCR